MRKEQIALAWHAVEAIFHSIRCKVYMDSIINEKRWLTVRSLLWAPQSDTI